LRGNFRCPLRDDQFKFRPNTLRALDGYPVRQTCQVMLLNRLARATSLTTVLVWLFAGAAAYPAPSPALKAALQLADSGAESRLDEELQQELCFALIRSDEFAAAQSRAATLPAFRHATVLLELARRLPAERRAEAEKLLSTAQSDLDLTLDWHKSRVSRWLAVTQAKLGQLEIAAKSARAVPDAEDRAFALRDVVLEFSRRGEVALARELRDAIEENRRYGTYRQKAAALSAIARALHAKGDRAGAEALLTQAASLLPKKPGWSDGGALLSVGLAGHACGQTDKAGELFNRAGALARGIGGAWKVSELTAVAAAWRDVGEKARAAELLAEAETLLAALPASERAPEALALARAHAAADNAGKARTLVAEALAEALREEKTGSGRAAQVRALLAWAEITGEAAVP